jgi:hypothetical protein
MLNAIPVISHAYIRDETERGRGILAEMMLGHFPMSSRFEAMTAE